MRPSSRYEGDAALPAGKAIGQFRDYRDMGMQPCDRVGQVESDEASFGGVQQGALMLDEDRDKGLIECQAESLGTKKSPSRRQWGNEGSGTRASARSLGKGYARQLLTGFRLRGRWQRLSPIRNPQWDSTIHLLESACKMFALVCAFPHSIILASIWLFGGASSAFSTKVNPV